MQIAYETQGLPEHRPSTIYQNGNIATIRELIDIDLRDLQSQVLEEAMEPEPLPFFFR